MAFRINRGVWQFQKEDGTYESKYKIATDGRLVQTDTLGNEVSTFGGSASWDTITGKPTTFSPSVHNHDDRYYTETEVNTLLAGKQAAGSYAASSHSHDWSTIVNRPTSLSQFTNNLGNYGSWITASHLGDYTNGTYRVIADYQGGSTWYIRESGQFIWGNGHDWTQSFRLSLSNSGTANGSWAMFGQQDSNASDGRYRGIRVRKYAGSAAVDGDISAGAYYIGDTRKDQNWDAAYSWGNHASAGYAAGSHTHAISSITGLQSALDGKQAAGSYAAASHTHAISNITGLQSALDGKQAAGSYAAASHTHDDRYYTESEVNSLLSGKLSTSGKAADSETVDGIDSTRIIYGDGSFGSTSWSDMNNTAQKSGFFFYNNPTGNPFGDWTHWINSMGNSWNPNYGFQLAHAFHSDRFAVRVVANGSFGSWRTIIDSGNIGSQSVNYAASAGSAGSANYATDSGYATSAGNSNTVGTLSVHAGRNNEANKIVRTDANGYIQAGWINTPSGATTSTLTRIYASQDDYVRYVTPAEFRRQITDGVYQVAGSYAAASHTHSIANVTGLQAALDAKQASSGAITTSNIGSQSVNYANSAGTADSIDGVAFRNTGSNSAVNADTLESNGITYYTSGVTNFSGNATDGALYSQAHSSSWQHQIAGDYRSGQIALRGKNNGTWQAWRTVLDSSNFSSWAAAASHTHTIANVTGLQAALDGKQASGSYAAASHTHTASQVGLGNVSNAAQVTTTNNTSLNTDSRNTRGVTRLYRRDDNSDYSLQTYWTGSYWMLDGYSGDNYHAGVQVKYANNAGEASYAFNAGEASFAFNAGYASESGGSNYATSAGSASSATTSTNVDNGNTYTTGNNLYIKNSGVNNYRIHHNGSIGVFDVTAQYSVRQMGTIWPAQRVEWGDYMSYMWFDVDPWGDNWGIGGTPRSWKTVNRGSLLTFGFEDWSDRRHKSAIVEIENAVEKVKSISGYTYWKVGSEVREAGVIAQDVLAVFPEGNGGGEDGYSVKPAALIGLLMKAVKEQQETIDSLIERITLLENR